VKSSFSEPRPSLRFELDERWSDDLANTTACLKLLEEEGNSLDDARLMLAPGKDDRKSAGQKLAAASAFLVG
jgi:hypothetical protein